MEQDWGNYWRGRSAQHSGEALVGVGIEQNESLKRFWNESFRNKPLDIKIVDVACGAGSVLKHAQVRGCTDLTALDIVPDAIAVIKKNIPNVRGVVSSVTDMPFDSNTFDFVTSQFGFEYAGTEDAIMQSMKEVIRILKPSGSFTAITHMRGSVIEKECLAALKQIQLVKSSSFIEVAKNMFKAAEQVRPTDQTSQDALFSALTAMNQSETQLVNWGRAQTYSNHEFTKFISFLLSSTRNAFEHRGAIPLGDNLKWLDEMNIEIDAYKGRMESMVSAAISEGTANALMALLRRAGFIANNPIPHYFEGEDMPVAWVLTTQN